MNSDVGGRSFLCGTRPDIVAAHRPQSAGVFEDVQADAVLVDESRARIRTHAGENSYGIAKPKSECVEMMNAHDPQRDPALPRLPRHPMGDRTHVDRRQHRLTEVTSNQQRTTCSNGLVVTHVLIDG